MGCGSSSEEVAGGDRKKDYNAGASAPPPAAENKPADAAPAADDGEGGGEKKGGKTKLAKPEGRRASVLVDVNPKGKTDAEQLAKKIVGKKKDGIMWMPHKVVGKSKTDRKIRLFMYVEEAKIKVDDIENLLDEFEKEVGGMDIVEWNKLQ